MYAYKWLIFFSFVWIILLLFSATMEYHTDNATFEGNTKVSQLQYLTNFKNMSYKSSGAEQSFVIFNPEYFKTVFQVLTWDFSFFDSDQAEYVRWIVFVPLTIGALWVIAQSLISVFQGFIP